MSTRRVLTFALAAILVAVGASGAYVLIRAPWTDPGREDVAAADIVTVPVELGTLTSQLRLNAALGYDEPVELPAARGMLTALPPAGQVVEVGSAVYEADGRPVILLKGKRPFWRDLASGARTGPDVRQLEQNLARLGFFDRDPDTRFDWWTTDAVRRWQKDLGLPVTGTVSPSDVVAVNAPSLRVAQVTGRLGQSDVSPLTYTATTLRAVAKLTTAQARELQAGTPVTVVLPDGTELENSLAAVDPGGQPTGEEGQSTPPTAVVEFEDQAEVAAAGPAAVRVIVHGDEESAETLIVPATALIATARDAYAVEVRDGAEIVRVPVQIGLVADARVQILASGPSAGEVDARRLSQGDAVVVSR